MGVEDILVRDVSMQLKPGPLESQPYLVKVPRGLAGKRNKKCKNGFFQCACSKPLYHMRKSQQNEIQRPQPWLNYTILLWKCFYLPLRALKAFLYFQLLKSNHFQLYVNTTAYYKNAVSGTQIISTCGRVFSCLLLTHKTSCHESQCDTEKNIHELQNPCVMHRLIYTHAHTHILYKEPCVPVTVDVLFVPALLTFRTARVLICFFWTM